jgi:hypothetical protein
VITVPADHWPRNRIPDNNKIGISDDACLKTDERVCDLEGGGRNEGSMELFRMIENVVILLKIVEDKRPLYRALIIEPLEIASRLVRGAFLSAQGDKTHRTEQYKSESFFHFVHLQSYLTERGDPP